jgi:hypothetical protein
MKIFFLFCIATCFYPFAAQSQVSPEDLFGTWDQSGGSRTPTMIFLDSSRVKFSYKDRSGASKKFYYLINNANTPVILTVDYKADHRKHRNEYLIQLIDKNTLKLQVIEKKDRRDHFDDEHPEKVFTLLKRM